MLCKRGTKCVAVIGPQSLSSAVFPSTGYVLYYQVYRWFSPYVIATMLVDGKQKIAHYFVLFVHQHFFISPLLFVSPETA